MGDETTMSAQIRRQNSLSSGTSPGGSRIMRQQPAQQRVTGAKRPWSTPEVRSVPLAEVLGHFQALHPKSQALANLVKKSGI
jgi:hypothetical protein